MSATENTYGRWYLEAPYGSEVEVGLETYPSQMDWVETRAAEVLAELAAEDRKDSGHIVHIGGGPSAFSMYGPAVDPDTGTVYGPNELIPAAPAPETRIHGGKRPTLRPYTVPRDWVAPADLLSRCQAAARLTLTGRAWSTEDRLECASDLVLRTLERHPRKSGYVAPEAAQMARLCHLAADWRKSREAQIARDTTDAAKTAATAFTPHTVAEDDGLRVAPMRAARVAIEAIQNLGADRRLWPLAYTVARTADGADGAAVAEELGMTHAAYRKAISRAGKSLGDIVPSSRVHGYVAHLEAVAASVEAMPLDRSTLALPAATEPDWPARSAKRYRGTEVRCYVSREVRRDGRKSYPLPTWTQGLPAGTARRLSTGATMKRAREAARTADQVSTRRMAAGLPATVR